MSANRLELPDDDRALFGDVSGLTEQYGPGYTYTNLTRMMKFADSYPDDRIVAPVAQQLPWNSICIALGIPDQHRRDFYLTFAAHERWSKRTLRAKIDERAGGYRELRKLTRKRLRFRGFRVDF